MKHLFTTLVLGIFCLSLSTASYGQSGVPKKTNEAEVTFIADLHCANCQKKVEAKLPFEKGVKDMKVNLEKKEIWILYQTDKTDKKKLIEAIAKLGYEAKEKV
jgi:copper chaperone CopZ